MIRLPSLRARVFLGALFWTAGLFIGGVLITTILMMRYRHFPTILHGTAYGHATVSSILTVLFLVFGLMLVRSGLLSVNRLRTRLADVREGRSRRIEGRYPSEVQPLVLVFEDLHWIDGETQALLDSLLRISDRRACSWS